MFESFNLLEFLAYIGVGIGAQLVDGALGMAYGVTATSALLSQGVLPAPASASVHVSKVFTGLSSGVAHWRLGHVDQKMMWRLAIPGAAGAMIGAYGLAQLDGKRLVPYFSLYLLVMALIILWRALNLWRGVEPQHKPLPAVEVEALGFVGGTLDAIGGGGWGPTVSSTLLGRGETPKVVIGSVNMAEFFVSVAASAVFLVHVDFVHLWPIILGLIIGGAVAAPFAAHVVKWVSLRWLMTSVGFLVLFLAVRGALKGFFPGFWNGLF